MFKNLMRKVKYYFQHDDIDTLLISIVASCQTHVRLPFTDNNGNITKRSVVGYNDKKVFIDVNGILAQFSKDRITLTNDELKELVECHKDRLTTHPKDYVQSRINQFSHLTGSAVKVRHTPTDTVYNIPFFRTDSGIVMDRNDPVRHVPLILVLDFYAHKILYLEDLTRVLPGAAARS